MLIVCKANAAAACEATVNDLFVDVCVVMADGLQVACGGAVTLVGWTHSLFCTLWACRSKIWFCDDKSLWPPEGRWRCCDKPMLAAQRGAM